MRNRYPIIIILMITAIGLSSCNIWILVDYFGTYHPIDKSFDKKYYNFNVDSHDLKNRIYEKLIVKDTTFRFYNYLYIKPYSIGIDYPLKTGFNCNEFYHDKNSKAIIDSIRLDFSQKYSIRFNEMLCIPECYDSLIHINIAFPWYLIDKNLYMSEFLTDTIFFGITYKKTETYRYKCAIIQRNGVSRLNLIKINCSYGKIKDSYNDKKFIKRGLHLFDKKIIRKLK